MRPVGKNKSSISDVWRPSERARALGYLECQVAGVERARGRCKSQMKSWNGKERRCDEDGESDDEERN